jgi:hypothetical protein
LAGERVYATLEHLYAFLGHGRAFAAVTGHYRRIKRGLNLKGDNAPIRYAACRVKTALRKPAPPAT